MLVFDLAVLNATEGVEETLRLGTGLLAKVVTLASVKVVDIRDWTDNGCCATCSSLLEGLKLLLGDRTALYLHAQVLGHLHQALVGDRGQDRG